MNRRGFLKSSSVAIAAATVYLPDVFTEKLPEKYVDPAEWFRENRGWLEDWFLKSEMEPHNDWIIDGHPMQIFRNEAVIDTNQRNNTIFRDSIRPKILKDIDYAHMTSILLACVFGVETTFSGTTCEGYPAPRTMSGFVDQTGRYPTRKDRIVVQYISLYRRFQYHRLLYDGGESMNPSDVVFSELRIKVL